MARDGGSRLVLASSNRGKLVEFADLFAGTGFDLVDQQSLGLDDAEETGLTFVENALLKARNATRVTGLPALGDDSGLCVDALGGAPGLYSARYAGTHGDARANIDKLLHAMHDVPDAARDAHYIAVIVLLRHVDDPQPVIVEGRWHGQVARAPRGAGGFGYDPVFVSTAHGCTAAELDAATRHRASHRGQAMAQLLHRMTPST